MRTSLYAWLPAMLLPLLAAEAQACRYTPLSWQQSVEADYSRTLAGQRKLVDWVRDRNRDFIDDEIAARFKPEDHIDVILDFNRCMPVADIRALLKRQRHGQLGYVGRLTTFAALRNVRVADLPRLAALPEVAMIEWQAPMHPQNDVSSRAVQARLSKSYAGAAETPGNGGFSGKDVVIAIVDEGVDEAHAAFQPGKFKGGFDTFSSSANPAGSWHGTQVAGVAMGARTGANCRPLQGMDASLTHDCAGVARDALLVDVRACCPAGTGSGALERVVEALEWIATDGMALGVKVVNISIGNCMDDDGKSVVAQTVDYVATRGISVVIGHGNAGGPCGKSQGDRFTMAPGSSSLAITVAASNDAGTVLRDDDAQYPYFLTGPRQDHVPAQPDPATLKPDLTAPGTGIFSAIPNSALSQDRYGIGSGTSLASPHVAGAAAILLEAHPTLPPGSLKHLLLSTADRRTPPAMAPCDPANPLCGWDPKFGYGLLNVQAALAASQADVRFPTCISDSVAPGQPCTRATPQEAWNNDVDLLTASAPEGGKANVVTARVTNSGTMPATVDVTFGVYLLAIGNQRFHHIGTQRRTIAAGATIDVEQAWTPLNHDHQCIRVSIDFGPDSDFSNNVTQRNLQVLPAAPGASMQLEVQVENPLMTPAQISLDARSDRAGWQCRLSETAFELDPFKQCPRRVAVRLLAPADARPGELANCHITARAAPDGAPPKLIGGVTVRTVIPKRRSDVNGSH